MPRYYHCNKRAHGVKRHTLGRTSFLWVKDIELESSLSLFPPSSSSFSSLRSLSTNPVHPSSSNQKSSLSSPLLISVLFDAFTRFSSSKQDAIQVKHPQKRQLSCCSAQNGLPAKSEFQTKKSLRRAQDGEEESEPRRERSKQGRCARKRDSCLFVSCVKRREVCLWCSSVILLSPPYLDDSALFFLFRRVFQPLNLVSAIFEGVRNQG